MKIAVDVDGVLADHVSAVLSRLRTEYESVDRTKSGMNHWDEPLPELDTSLKQEINTAELDQDFVRDMPPIEGAVKATNILADQGHELVIVTARSEESLPVTHQWLEANCIPHNVEKSLSTRGQRKTISDASVLIDDFHGHVRDFADAGKYSILFIQPWNEAYVSKLTESQRIFSAEGWREVLHIIDSLSESSERRY